MPSNWISLRGVGEPMVPPIELRAGPLTMRFEPDTLYLRHIRMGDREVLLAIYGAVRDHQWNTVPGSISNLRVDRRTDSFELEFDVACRQGAVDFRWKGRIAGSAQGTVVFSFDGQSESDFLRNRIGICVLHPQEECAGSGFNLTHVGGAAERAFWPKLVGNDPIFKNIKAVEHEVVEGILARVEFEGEVFEMEDQRNYTDASYKTYSTPQERPKPAQVRIGDAVRQVATLSLSAAREFPSTLANQIPEIRISQGRPVPKAAVGLRMAHLGGPLTPGELGRLKPLGLSHLRVDLDLSRGGFGERLREATNLSEVLGIPLHAALFVSDAAEKELEELKTELGVRPPNVALWLVFHLAENRTGEKWVRLAAEKLAGLGGSVSLAAGSKDLFYHLNHARAGGAALPCFGMGPEVHATDEFTVVENLGGQAVAVESAREFSGRPVVVSPIAFRTQPAPAPESPSPAGGAELPGYVDARQMSLLGAGWTLGSLARLLPLGESLHSLTYFETVGWLGVMERDAGGAAPALFPSQPGQLFPLYHVLRSIAGFSQVAPTRSSHPLAVEALVVETPDGKRRVLVANLTGSETKARIPTDGKAATVRRLEQASLAAAMADADYLHAPGGVEIEANEGFFSVALAPYAVARLDLI